MLAISARFAPLADFPTDFAAAFAGFAATLAAAPFTRVLAPRRTAVPLLWPFLPAAALPTFLTLADLSEDLRGDLDERDLLTLGMGAYLPCPPRQRKPLSAHYYAPLAPLRAAPFQPRERPRFGTAPRLW